MTAEKVWEKLPQVSDLRGCIPVYDGSSTGWKVFRNSQTIFPGVENCADPAKVDVLRQNVVSLLEKYPNTLPQLERLGIRVKALLNKEIKTFDDVVAWSNSIFNSGPTTQPLGHVADTIDLAYDDMVIEVKTGRNPVYVVPVFPRDSGRAGETRGFSVPGSRTRYGSGHPNSKAAFAKQVPPKPKSKKKPVRYRGQTAEGEPMRPRGRPRNDGLIPGSVEARRADRKTAKEKAARRKARESGATITKLPRKRLVRIGQQAAASS
jgi:hypothetical protein